MPSTWFPNSIQLFLGSLAALGLGAGMSADHVGWQNFFFAVSAFLFLWAIILPFFKPGWHEHLKPLHEFRLRKPWERLNAATASEPPYRLDRSLNVGNVFVNLDELSSAKRIGITFRCFYGRPKILKLGDLGGNIVLQSNSIGRHNLPKPSLKTTSRDLVQQFYIELEQSIPDELIDSINSALERDGQIFLMFSSLNLMIEEGGETPGNARLPLWDGVGVHRKEIAFVTSQIIEVTGTLRG